ncbi:MAG TPA: S9 family peptidase [Sphingomonadaceae bacterium]|nr:S9 family peptidase [Sphingomonadaceae bacterium]
MTEADVARLESVNEIAVSPDGARIAYVTLWRPDVTSGEADDGPRGQLMLAWGENAGRPFLPREMDIGRIGFSPDGLLISFIWAEPDGNLAVWGIPVDGGGQRKLAEIHNSNVLDYGWAPDSSVLYVLADSGIDFSQRERSEAGFDAFLFEEEWRYNRLFAVTPGAETETGPRQIPLPGHVDRVRIAPNGRFAAITAAPTPSLDHDRTSKRIHLVDLADGRIRATVPTEAKLGDVEISPDSRQLSVIAASGKHDPGKTTLFLFDIADRELTPLNEDAPEAAMDAEWLEDGRLAAVIHVGVQSRLRTYSADGSILGETDPQGLILEQLDSAGGTLAASANAPGHPDELFVFDGGSFARWTLHNPWLADIDFGIQRRFAFAARDGQEIEGVLVEPVSGAQRGGAATILDIHGGPETHESNGWVTSATSPGQVAAGRGYAVFLPNYRGSTGYGVAFSQQHQGDYAGKEFDDLLDAKLALVEAGIADPERVGITGGSYGGYATAWAATALSEEFAAGVMFAGITDQVSKYGTTDIPTEMVDVHARQYPWDDWLGFLEASPIYHAGRADTPLLIAHGMLDRRVDRSQAQELYRAIKVRTDTPVRLVYYPREAHGLRRAAARYDFNVRMMRWFDTYLMTGDRNAELPPPGFELPQAEAAD